MSDKITGGRPGATGERPGLWSGAVGSRIFLLLPMYKHKMAQLGLRTIDRKQLNLTNEAEEELLYEKLKDIFPIEVEDRYFVMWYGKKDSNHYDQYAPYDFEVHRKVYDVVRFHTKYEYTENYDSNINCINEDYNENKTPYMCIETKTRFAQDIERDARGYAKKGADGKYLYKDTYHIMNYDDMVAFSSVYRTNANNEWIRKDEYGNILQPIRKEKSLFCPLSKMNEFKHQTSIGNPCYYVNYINYTGTPQFYVAKYKPEWWNNIKLSTYDISLTTGKGVKTLTYLIPFTEFEKLENYNFTWSV